MSAPGLLFLVLTVTFASVDWVMSLDPRVVLDDLRPADDRRLGPDGARADDRRPGASSTRTRPLAGAPHAAALPRPRQAAPRLHDAVGVSELLAVPDHLVGQPAGRDPLVRPAHHAAAWGAVAIALVVGHFVPALPAAAVAGSQEAAGLLARVAIFIIAMRLVDLIWLVAPDVPARHGFPIHWMDIAVPLGLAGIWLFLFARNLRSRALMPVNDPYFKEAFAHEAH